MSPDENVHRIFIWNYACRSQVRQFENGNVGGLDEHERKWMTAQPVVGMQANNCHDIRSICGATQWCSCYLVPLPVVSQHVMTTRVPGTSIYTVTCTNTLISFYKQQRNDEQLLFLAAHTLNSRIPLDCSINNDWINQCHEDAFHLASLLFRKGAKLLWKLQSTSESPCWATIALSGGLSRLGWLGKTIHSALYLRWYLNGCC